VLGIDAYIRLKSREMVVGSVSDELFFHLMEDFPVLTFKCSFGVLHSPAEMDIVDSCYRRLISQVQYLWC